MRQDLPANPLAIQLTVAHERLWWQVDDLDEQPERWSVSADVWGMEDTEDEARHVGDISLALADLSVERDLLDASILGEWTLDFIPSIVVDQASGTLHPDLERMLTPGPPHMVVLRRISIAEPWRGTGLGAAVTASTLRVFARYARFAACRVTPEDFTTDGGDHLSAELAAVRFTRMLETTGFQLWQGIFVVDLRSPALLETRSRLLKGWWPDDDEDRGDVV